MARDKDPVVFLFGPSGAGKSTLAQWLAKDSAFLHLEIDLYPDGDGIDAAGLRGEWDAFESAGIPGPLVAEIRLRTSNSKAAGAVLSFPSTLVFSASKLIELRDAGVASLILYGSAAACLNAFLEHEQKRKRVAGNPVDFWISQNQHSYLEFSRPDLAPFRVTTFRNGGRVPREELVTEVQRRAAA